MVSTPLLNSLRSNSTAKAASGCWPLPSTTDDTAPLNDTNSFSDAPMASDEIDFSAVAAIVTLPPASMSAPSRAAAATRSLATTRSMPAPIEAPCEAAATAPAAPRTRRSSSASMATCWNPVRQPTSWFTLTFSSRYASVMVSIVLTEMPPAMAMVPDTLPAMAMSKMSLNDEAPTCNIPPASTA